MSEKFEKEIEIKKESQEAEETQITKQTISYLDVSPLEKESRKFNIDLEPRYVLCNGSLVNLLVQSGVSQYLEFKALECCYLYISGQENRITEVPCNRSDVFKSKMLSLKDKRFLMKFMTFCMDYFKGDQPLPEGTTEETPFVSFLNSQEIVDGLQKFVVYSIAQIESEQEMGEGGVSVKEGLERMKLFISSLGKFNANTPYLTPIFGTNELVQSFCRLSAVHGGIYILRRYPKKLILSNKEGKQVYEGIICSEGQTLSSKYFIGSCTSLPQYIKSQEV